MASIETFQLIFKGDRCGAYKELPIEKHLALLKFTDSAISKMASGKHIALKKKLSYEDANSQKKKFESLGLVTSITLELNENLFQLGLKRKQPKIVTKQQSIISAETKSASNTNKQEGNNTSQTNNPVHIIDQKATIPAIFSSPGDYQIKNPSNQCLLRLKNYAYSAQGFLLIATSAGIGLTLQSYIIALALSFGLANTLATIIGIAFLFVFALALPKVLQPLQYCELTLKDQVIKLIDEFNFMPSRHSIIWAIESNNTEGTISLSSNSASAYNDSLSYHWDSQLKTEHAGEAAIEDIQKHLIEDTIIGTALSFIDKLKTALIIFKPNKKKFDWDNASSTFISNQDDQIVALIYDTPEKAYRIIDSSLSNDIILHAFCVSVHRVRMV